MDRVALLLSRAMLLVFTVFPTYYALASPPDLRLLLIYVGTGGILAATFGPYVVGLCWKGATRTGAIASMIAGEIVYMVVLLGFGQQALVAGPIGVAAGLVTIYVVSLVTPGHPSTDFVQKLFYTGGARGRRDRRCRDSGGTTT